MSAFYGDSFKYSQSSDSLAGLDRKVSLTDKPKPEKRFVTNLSASRIDDLVKRVREQDIIIASQNAKILELEMKMEKLMDILERNNDVWFHRDMLNGINK